VGWVGRVECEGTRERESKKKEKFLSMKKGEEKTPSQEPFFLEDPELRTSVTNSRLEKKKTRGNVNRY